MKEDPRPIYVSTMLMRKEEKQYFHLLSKYRDVFALSYKKMPGLDIKVYNLAIKKSVSPKKQLQHRFRRQLIPKIEER